MANYGAFWTEKIGYGSKARTLYNFSGYAEKWLYVATDEVIKKGRYQLKALIFEEVAHPEDRPRYLAVAIKVDTRRKGKYELLRTRVYNTLGQLRKVMKNP